MISYFYKRTLPIIILLVTSASVAWSASYTEAIRGTRDLSLQQFILDKSFLRATKPILDNILYKQVMDIIIISKDSLRKEYKNVKEIIFDEKSNKEGKKVSLNEQVIAAYPDLNFIYFDLSTNDKKKNVNTFIVNTFAYLEYMIYQNKQKNFIIYMDFNVKYEKNLCKHIQDAFKKFEDNSIIITNTELGDLDYDYNDLKFMLPTFNKGDHVLTVGPESLKIDPGKLKIDVIDLSDEKIETKKSELIDRLKVKFKNNTDIKFEQFKEDLVGSNITAENISIESSKEYFITNGISSHYAALQCCVLTALAWLINSDFGNIELIKKIKSKYSSNQVFDFKKFITHIEKRNFKKEINFKFPTKSESKRIYFELNEYNSKKLPIDAELNIKLSAYQNITITKKAISLQNNETTIETLPWKKAEEKRPEICLEGNNNKEETFSCLMTLDKNRINLAINGSHYTFKNIEYEYDYDKINNIVITQKAFARNFKTLFDLTPQNDVLEELKTSDSSNINIDNIKYENSVAVLFIVNKFKDTSFNEFNDNIQKLIEKLSDQGFEVHILMGKEATMENLLELFEKIKPSSKDKLSRLVFYYFGHTKHIIDKDYSENFFLTCYTGEHEEQDNLLTPNQVRNVIKVLNFTHTAVFVDSCSSSRMIEKESTYLNSKKHTDPSFYLITASKEEIYAKGLLAQCFVKALNKIDSPHSLNNICIKMKEIAKQEIVYLKNSGSMENRLNTALMIDPAIYKDDKKGGNFFFIKCSDIKEHININGKDVPKEKFKLKDY